MFLRYSVYMEKRMVAGVSYVVKINNLNGISEMNMDCSWSVVVMLNLTVLFVFDLSSSRE